MHCLDAFEYNIWHKSRHHGDDAKRARAEYFGARGKAPSKLYDIKAVRIYLKQHVQQGQAEQALEMPLDLLVRLKDAHTATTVRPYDALTKLYGRKSERLNPNQLELFVSELLKGSGGDDSQADHAPKKDKKKRKPRGKQGPRGRQALPDNLPRREQEVMPEKDKCICGCG